MRGRLSALVLILGVGVTGAVLMGPAGAAPRASVQKAPKTVHVMIPLPAPGQSQVSQVTVKAKADKGQKVGALKVTTANDAQLGNASLVYIIQAPKKKSARATFQVYALIRRFAAVPGPPSARAAQTANTLDLKIEFGNALAGVKTTHPAEQNCSVLGQLDGLFESGATSVLKESFTFTLKTGRSLIAQDSPAEEVLDNVIELAWTQKGCAGKPEGDDPGNT